jgi:hypothetical protein
MRKLLALVVLLSLASAGRAGEKEIIVRLLEAGVFLQRYSDSDDDLYVILEANNLDAFAAELCELRGLRYLVLRHPKITDAQLRQVCALPWLKYLHLGDCPLTDAKLKIVAGARGLEDLCIFDPTITDAGLRHLEGMRGLARLNLCRCRNLTEEGIARLQKVLPNCHIER